MENYVQKKAFYSPLLVHFITASTRVISNANFNYLLNLSSAATAVLSKIFSHQSSMTSSYDNSLETA